MTQTEDKNQNPTKTIAIKGGAEGAAPPKITAKGEGLLAEKLLDIAFAEGVKVRRDKDLIELLDAFEVESPIPLEALHTVSLILERVYAENKAMDTNDEVDDLNITPQTTPTFDGETGEPVIPDRANFMDETTKGPTS